MPSSYDAAKPHSHALSAKEGTGSRAATIKAPLDPSASTDTSVELPSDATRVYLSEQQFCDTYLVAPRTAQRWRVTGDGPPFCRMGPKKIVYRLSDIEQWAASRTFKHRAQELAQSVRANAIPNAPNRAADSDRSDEDNVDSSRARRAPSKVTTGEAP